MNKKVIVVSLLGLLLVPAAQGFAQKIPVKKLNSAKLERTVMRNVDRLAPRVSGVYIPAGTTVSALERKVALTAQKANVKLSETDVRVIAAHPEALRQFQVQTGMAIFEGRPMPKAKSLQVLLVNQEKFAAVRANGTYEEAWAEFQAEKKSKLSKYYEEDANVEEFYAQGGDFFQKGKSYGEFDAIAIDVYNFYVKQIGTENLPRVRMEDGPEFEGVVCEFPVNGFSIVRPRPFEDEIELPAENFVVLHSNNSTRVIARRTLQNIYRVIK